MSDSVRMLDSAALTRGLDEFRRIDPEQRALGHRLAGEAAAHKLEDLRRDIPLNEKPPDVQTRDRDGGKNGGGSSKGGQDPGAAPEEKEKAAPPEIDEGRVLDIKV